MQQIVNFILRNKTFLLFAFLLFIALTLTIQSHSYHKSRFINSANFVSGGIYNASNNISDYFGLREQNILLQEENNRLRSALFNADIQADSTYIDSLHFTKNYKFTEAKVIRNNYAFTNNVLLINKGKKDSVIQDLGVISSKGIIGIIENTNNNYATVISILNTTNRISAQLKKTNHFGSLHWNAKSPKFIQLTEIPKIAPVAEGDTIITSGRSSIFPKGILIGTVSSFKLDAAENYYEIEISLFNDMTNIEHVYVIENTDKTAIKTLLNTIDD
ncbi:rod shape-determining protein MreC [Lacinutrix neustonica]|uniref:Cell shape-determining protein MreC n=1 Tax=Lacinutrix neustonica TaxID=2980107 RepID=A0A9E8SCP2_9FLAO|nr:rod shape-determining protein MreC [Lacinutrix neustonica]WAC01548.1 rod shape-determining protein MreC [Lacinutrix neustonica]